MWTESIGFHAHFCQFVNRKTCDIQPNLEFRTEIEWDICATSFRKEQQSWGRQSLSDPDSRKAGYIYIYLNIYTEVVAEISSLLLLTKRPRRERPESQRNIVLWYLFEYNFDTFQESPSVGNRLQMSPKMLLFSKSTNFLPDLPFTPISFSVKWRGFSFWTSWHILPVVKSFFLCICLWNPVDEAFPLTLFLLLLSVTRTCHSISPACWSVSRRRVYL